MAAGGSDRNCDAEPDAWLTYGPPIVRCTVDLDADEEEQLVPLDRPADRAAEHVLVVLGLVAGSPAGSSCARASSRASRYSNAEPCSVFVPLLICTFTDAPPAMPCSASKLLVTTLTVSIASMAGRVGLQALNPLVRRADAVETERPCSSRARR